RSFSACPRKLLLHELGVELAVAVEQDPGFLVVDRAAHIHRAAAAQLRFGLEHALAVELGFEVATIAALLLELALDVRAVDLDVDGHLVGRALRSTLHVDALAGPRIRHRRGLRRRYERQRADGAEG